VEEPQSTPDETLIPDARAGLSPRDMVDQKLWALLGYSVYKSRFIIKKVLMNYVVASTVNGEVHYYGPFSSYEEAFRWEADRERVPTYPGAIINLEDPGQLPSLRRESLVTKEHKLLADEVQKLFQSTTSVGPDSSPEEVRAYCLSQVRRGETSWLVSSADQALLRAWDVFITSMSVTDIQVIINNIR
jgi:hypothetical protein